MVYFLFILNMTTFDITKSLMDSYFRLLQVTLQFGCQELNIQGRIGSKIKFIVSGEERVSHFLNFIVTFPMA